MSQNRTNPKEHQNIRASTTTPRNTKGNQSRKINKSSIKSQSQEVDVPAKEKGGLANEYKELAKEYEKELKKREELKKEKSHLEEQISQAYAQQLSLEKEIYDGYYKK